MPVAKPTRLTASFARTLLPALVAAGWLALTGALTRAAEPAPPAEMSGPALPGEVTTPIVPGEGTRPFVPGEMMRPVDPQLTPPGGMTVPAAPAQPLAEERRTFQPAPVPTPDLSIAPQSPVVMPCDDEYWIASSWRCRQTAPHGCACGDLDFYHVGGGGSQLLNRESFAASLTPGVPVCIVVHGSFTNWKGLCDDCAPVLRWIRSGAPGRPLHVLFYTWPSQGGITYEPHIDVGILGCRASFNGVYLAELVARIPPGHPVCLIGHSHGARLVASALHVLGGGEVDNVRLNWPAPPDLRVRGVLVAGALDHHWLDPGQRFDMALCRTESLLVLRNDHDIVLTFYPLRRPFSKRALGERGLSGRDVRRLGAMSSKVCVLDVTRLVQTG
ncbi:MAG TPA: hypothetical protein VFG04_25915, partial [Planctomycetaceae bacterium]|nr:hypothetical protein [Planctomycetaceae bacterium]